MAQPTTARGRRTRTALLDATRALLEERGFGALTMAAVAERAGVTRRSVYLHFASRAELVGALFDHVAEAEGLADSLERVWDAADAGAALDAWAAHLARYHTRVLAVDRAVAREQHNDPDAAAHRARTSQAKYANCRRLAQWLQAEGRLVPPWTAVTAADIIFALSASDVVEGLTVDRRWSRGRLATHLGALLRAALTGTATATAGTSCGGTAGRDTGRTGCAARN
ncbi:TetR/AcrR family transcriptional regulator [Streptomyces sp. YIM 98790]|uniref:TetR/AcrR family transcriptional regulator n=1 Tax=Streptomyces sp. YIM 98790 TaxID=2689077 RepID=UPI00140BC27E|nr:TetR/AcrR family transcriptional regulator [Streptomyces sp. YIM 98790]